VFTGSGIELQVTDTGVRIGNLGTDRHQVSGSLSLSGSASFISGSVILSQVSASFNFANDAAAATGGVPLGGLYRSGSFVLIRLT
jgi:hypothetical protein